MKIVGIELELLTDAIMILFYENAFTVKIARAINTGGLCHNHFHMMNLNLLKILQCLHMMLL